MSDRTANLLGVVSLAIADQIRDSLQETLRHSGETPAALVVIGYDTGLSNDALRKVLGLSHPGTVRLVDRLVADGLAQRRQGRDKRAVALYLTPAGHAVRAALLDQRIEAIQSFFAGLSREEVSVLDSLLHKLLASMNATDLERQSLCRLCKDSVCDNCPIPANFRSERVETGAESERVSP